MPGRRLLILVHRTWNEAVALAALASCRGGRHDSTSSFTFPSFPFPSFLPSLPSPLPRNSQLPRPLPAHPQLASRIPHRRELQLAAPGSPPIVISPTVKTSISYPSRSLSPTSAPNAHASLLLLLPSCSCCIPPLPTVAVLGRKNRAHVCLTSKCQCRRPVAPRP